MMKLKANLEAICLPPTTKRSIIEMLRVPWMPVVVLKMSGSIW